MSATKFVQDGVVVFLRHNLNPPVLLIINFRKLLYEVLIIPKNAKVVNLGNLGNFKIPKEMTLQKAQKEVNFTILTPSYLPEGYKFASAMVLAFTFSKKIVAITYKKEESKILLHFSEHRGTKPFPGPGAKVININGNKGYYSSINTINVLSWTSNNMVFVLTSQLSKKDMEKIAESVK
ncbi:hypothetical protein IPdc08_01909 [archaeon]|nr:hypothetical protein IPdc08_01909 [archaeon]